MAFLLLAGFRSEFGLVLHLEDLANLSGLVIYLGNAGGDGQGDLCLCSGGGWS